MTTSSPSGGTSAAARFDRLVERAPLWGIGVTPSELAEVPVHRWFQLNNSFSPSLVDGLLDELLGRFPSWRGRTVLDPFCGAGTTLVASRLRGLSPVGVDLSPLAVLASKVKTATLDPDGMATALDLVRGGGGTGCDPADGVECERVMSPEVLAEALRLLGLSRSRDLSEGAGAALCLALLAEVSAASLLPRRGGFRKWAPAVPENQDPLYLREAVVTRIELMIEDLRHISPEASAKRALVLRGDARTLRLESGSVDVIVTSPPAPNRQDPTRAYGLELALAFCSHDETETLRRQSLRSYPEADPPRLPAPVIVAKAPTLARRTATAIAAASGKRAEMRLVPRMLIGWSADIGTALAEMARVLSPDSGVAVVCRNYSYAGVEFESDRIVAELMESSGIRVDRIAVARMRRPSHQQIMRHRTGMRESVVIGTKRTRRRPTRRPSSVVRRYEPQPAVLVGQIWADDDPRSRRRRVLVVAVDTTHATVETIVTVDGQSLHEETRRPRSRVLLKRFHPVNYAYLLYQDVLWSLLEVPD